MSDALRALVEEHLVVESTGWAAERIARVLDRLQRTVPLEQRFEGLVVWSDTHNAFTGPGKTVYITRRLLEMLPDDDGAAIVIAHEIAHHRLGHVASKLPINRWLKLEFVLFVLKQVIATKNRERQADLLSIEMCLEAGYDPDKCINACEIIQQVFLDYGDIDGALGREDGDRDRHLSERGYDSELDRIAAMRAHVEAFRRGERIHVEAHAERAHRQRKVMLAAAGGAVATVALLLLRRR